MLKGQESRRKDTKPWDRKEETHGAEWGASASPSPERVLPARFITRGLSGTARARLLCLAGGHSVG